MFNIFVTVLVTLYFLIFISLLKYFRDSIPDELKDDKRYKAYAAFAIVIWPIFFVSAIIKDKLKRRV